MEGERETDINSSNETTTERVRLHVGGLGESVTRDDLSNLFLKLGFSIESIDIIRSKGRSFAYMNLSLSSVNSLSKLFSSYNGCAWKGGRLRLEKAKEHYLHRLNREWAEDAQLASSTSDSDVSGYVDKKTEHQQKHKKDLSSEKKQLRIFFPRLQKLKSVPFSGTGKHKYSFRCVEVSSLPVHFCDCEEHSGHLNATKGKKLPVLEEQGNGMKQEELDMMNSIMNRLFKMENVSGASHSDIELTNEEECSMKATDDLQHDESEAYLSADEDNLIINVVSRKETSFTNQESKSYKRKASEDRSTCELPKERMRKHEEKTTNENGSIISHGKGSSDGRGVLSGDQVIGSQSSVKKAASGVSWFQKASWRELVGYGSNNGVNISDLFHGNSFNKEEDTKSDAVQISNKRKNKKSLKHENQRSQLNESETHGVGEAQESKPSIASDNAGRGSAWLHKASWTQLVNSNNSNSFSLAQILSGVTSEKQEPIKSDGHKIADSQDWKHHGTVETGKNDSSIDVAADFGIGRNGNMRRAPESSQLIVPDNDDTAALTEDKSNAATKQNGTEIVAIGEILPCITAEESNYNTSTDNKNNAATKQKGFGAVSIGETRPFMRTEESVKQWENLRAALGGSRKRSKVK